MNKNQDHLTVEQIESLMAIEPDREPSPEQAILRDCAELHLAQCAACREALAIETEAQQRMRRLAAGNETTVTGECPSRTRVYEFAAKLLRNEVPNVVMDHLCQCDRCAPVLRQAIDDLKTETTAEEAVLIESLATAKPEWQASLAQRLAESSRTRREKRPWLFWRYPRLELSIGAATGFAVIALFMISR